jgi:tetratricopeptide (TPR) repeat protein
MLAMTLVFAQIAGGAGGPPKECAALAVQGGSNVWEHVKSPNLGRYCDLLASATAKLGGPAHGVAEIIAIADEADRLVPGRPAAPILRGRALARLGQYSASVDALKEAKARDDLALNEPEALLVWARVQSFTGRSEEALDAYRALMPRASGLGLAERGVVYVGAGMLAMATGPKGIDEAVSILRRARKDSQDVAQRVAALALALALDRAGEKAEARLILKERPRDNAPALLAEPAAIESMGPEWDVEHLAMVAFALEAVDPLRAGQGWIAYLEGRGGHGAWADHARQHLASHLAEGHRAEGGRRR